MRAGVLKFTLLKTPATTRGTGGSSDGARKKGQGKEVGRVEGTRIASLRFRYDSPDVYVRRGIKSSWTCCVHPSRALLMGSMSARKQRVRRAEAVEGMANRGRKVSAEME